MTWDEVQKNLIDLLSNPDAGLEKQNKFIQDLQKDYITRDSINETMKQKDQQIKDLQTTNATLAQKYISMLDVSQAKKPEEEEEEEENPMETPEDLDNFLATLTAENKEE